MCFESVKKFARVGIYVCVCVCVCVYIYIYIYMEVGVFCEQNFFSRLLQK